MRRLAQRIALPAILAVSLPSAHVRGAEPTRQPAAAQAGPSDAPYTQGPVWELSFIRIVAGMGDDYLKSLATTWKATMEEAKKQGFILSYKILDANPSGPDDWDLLLMVEFKNWAALDGADARFRAIESKVVGNADQTRSLMTKRLEVRRILGSKLAQELTLK